MIECGSNDHFIKHAHLPQSILAARVVWGRWEMDIFKVMVDVELCPGCCDGPCGWTATSNDCDSLPTPGLMEMVFHPYFLRLDGWSASLDECSSQRIVLGDYGDYSNGTLIHSGNIFEDMRTLGIDATDSAYCPVVSRIFGYERFISHENDQDDLVVAYHDQEKYLALCQPKGLSLPANKWFVLLLKALSTRLSGKHLVITVIQCSDFYGVDDNGERRESGEDSASDRGSHFAEPRILTPLYTVASPQVWRRELLSLQRWDQFSKIREHFYALVNMHQSTGPETRHKSAIRQKKDGMVKFFSDMFGLQHLRSYVGKITFFERLPWMMETDSPREDFVETAEEHGLLVRLFKGIRQSNAVQDPRLEVVLPLLRKRCQTLGAKDDAPHRYADEKQKVKRELESISQTLSAGLLNHTGSTFCSPCLEHVQS
ncbi:hypothetical protein BKA82DRAFT_767266 [Pisolithus tinctorius]|uniref:Uncharacterized protein n=1 Tax=Pisolithus tinctorius Marx 270 TaxID=870435 RepID=A0A0C3NY72_PISTI|nr:hypothetical protein BKA82DRAFT_767266 [Pisolithus tinctorius]KIO00266.1 hypothetical protein M404DRAFT_767266 [Pisolithus tinctorius Marx 270]